MSRTTNLSISRLTTTPLIFCFFPAATWLVTVAFPCVCAAAGRHSAMAVNETDNNENDLAFLIWFPPIVSLKITVVKFQPPAEINCFFYSGYDANRESRSEVF